MANFRPWVLLGCLLPLGACFDLVVKSPDTNSLLGKLSSTSLVESTTTEDGAVVASISAQSKSTQIMTAGKNSAIGGTSVAIPPGSLNIDTRITLEEASSLATPAVVAELGISAAVQQAGTSVAVQSETPMDAKRPFILSIPLPILAALTAEENWDNLIVLYKIKVEASQQIKIGLIPRQDIKIQKGMAEVTVSNFGAYQTVLTSVPVVEKKEVASTTPVLTKQEEIAQAAQPSTSGTETNTASVGTEAPASTSSSAENPVSQAPAEVVSPPETPGPTVSLTGMPTGTSNAASLTAVVGGSGVTHYKYKLRSGTEAACSVAAGYSSQSSVSTPISFSLASLSDGTIEICAIGRDSAGRWQLESAATTASWIKDRTAPTASVSGEPSGTNAAALLDISVAGTDATHYKYKIRVPSDAACSVATGYSQERAIATKISDSISSKADGVIQICVIARDAHGNWQREDSATSVSWTKDRTAPTAVLSGQPTGTSLIGVLDISVAGSDVTHYKYKIRVPSDAACSVATDYSAERAVAIKIDDSISSKADGVIQICVIARDAQSNWQLEAAATSVSWTKDQTAPTAVLGGQPTGTSLIGVLDVSVAGTEVTHYKYKIREPSDAPCSDAGGYSAERTISTKISDSISAKADGTLQICAIARDAQGNWQLEAAATSVSWTKDQAAPTALISGEPTGTSSTGILDVSVAGSDVTHYKYKVRASSEAACSVASGYSSEKAVALKITDSLASKADGAIEICVIARDAQGNWQLEAVATSVSWTKDQTAPTAGLSGEPTGTNSISTLDVSVSGSDVTHYKYKIRLSSEPACSVASGYSVEKAVALKITTDVSTYPDEVLELCVIGRDAYGNWQLESSATSVSWIKDQTAPTATLSGQPTGSHATSSLDITVAGNNVTHYKYKIRESSDAACSNLSGYSSESAISVHITDDISALADGLFQICVIGRDTLGNWQGTNSVTNSSWTKDTLAPSASLSGAPSGTSAVGALDITVAGSDVTHYKYKIRIPSDAACSVASGYSAERAIASKISNDISSVADGVIQICAIGRDAAGNWQAEASASTLSWTKDQTAPTASLSGEPTGMNAVTLLDVTVGGTDVTHYRFKLRESGDSACSVASDYSAQIAVASKISSSIAALADGTIELCVIGRDASGNWQSEASASTASWSKNLTPPTSNLSGEPTGVSSATLLNITVGGTYVTHYRYKIRGSSDGPCSDSSGYGAEQAIATSISDNLAARDDGVLELCVVGRGITNIYQSFANATTASWTKDALSPSAAQTFHAAPRKASLKLAWTSGTTDVKGFLVLRRSSSAVSDAPTTGTTYTVGQTIGSSSVAYVGTALNFVDAALTNGTRYSYKIFAHDAVKNYSSGLQASAKPVTYEAPAADTLLLWTDTSYIDSLYTDSSCASPVTANNETVGCLKDLTAKKATLTQSVSGNRPVYKSAGVNAHPSLLHSDNHWVRATTSDLPSGNLEHSVVFIGSIADTASSGALHIGAVGAAATDSVIQLFAEGDAMAYDFGSNKLKFPLGGVTAPRLYFGTYNGVDGTATNRKFYINGVAVNSNASSGDLNNPLNLPSSPAIEIGGNSATNLHTGDSAEVLLYDHVLTPEERVELSRYAWDKWDIPQITLSLSTAVTGVGLSWTDGLDSDSYLVIRSASIAPTFVPTDTVAYTAGNQGSDQIVYAGSTKSYTDTSIVEGVNYHYALYGVDSNLNYTPVVSAETKTLKTPNLSAAVDDAKLNLSWTSVAEASGYLLVRRTSAAPVFVPTNETVYVTGSVGASDTIVYKGSASSYMNTNLTNGSTYYYKLYAYDAFNNYAAASSANAAPASSCVGSTMTYTSNATVTVPAGCTTLLAKAWGAGGAGASRNGASLSGNGGGGGYATKTMTVTPGSSIDVKVGIKGQCSSTPGTGYASGGAGGSSGNGSVGGGTGTGGTGGSGGFAGGAGKYGGGGGAGNAAGSTSGGGGGGASAVSISGSPQVIAGGGGGGGVAGEDHFGGSGGAGCALNGGAAGGSNSGGGGGGGACLGTTTANGSGKTPGNSTEASPNGVGGSYTTGTCATGNNGTDGKVILTFSP